MRLNSQQMVRILAKGGILTPSYLLNILNVVKESGNRHVHFGSRQDLLFHVNKTKMQHVQDAFTSMHTNYIIYGKKGSTAQNIVSSYVAADMMTSTSWLSSGNYLYILENFNYQPTLRINIADPRQSLVPLYFGHLNYVASPIKDYWYLYIRRNFMVLPERWPVLVLNGDIARLSENLEQNWSLIEKESTADAFEKIQNGLDYNWRKVENELKLEQISMPDYEGFGKMYNSQNYWAGFYWRNNCYDIPFLEEVCRLCLKGGISKVSLTPWKSFLIKDIQEKDLIHWNRLLGRFGINMRHSSFELNWHLPIQDKLALKLKRFIVREFDKVDVSVNGLTFGIKTKPEPSFCSIQIERVPGLKFLNRFDIFATYKVLHAKNFNANTCEYEEYITQVPRHRLPSVIQSLTLKYYAQLLKLGEKQTSEPVLEKVEKHLVYQCQHCLSIYNDRSDVDITGVKTGVAFQDLPETYTCPLCDGTKSDYRPLYMSQLLKEANA